MVDDTFKKLNLYGINKQDNIASNLSALATGAVQPIVQQIDSGPVEINFITQLIMNVMWIVCLKRQMIGLLSVAVM